MKRLFATVFATALFLTCIDVCAQTAVSSSAGAVAHDLQRTQDAVQKQRKQSDQLKTRVGGLENQAAANRAQLDQRDRQIADLQHQLDALQAAQKTPPPATGRSGG